MDDLLSDRTAVVTGGASGNGRAIALRFAEHGADVVVADRRETPREDGTPTHELAAQRHGVETRFAETDVTNVPDLEAAVAAADALGGVDVMVNNAGVVGEPDFLDTTVEDYRRVMDINVMGVFFGAQAAARRMVANDGGAIVNLSSDVGYRGSGGAVVYGASKGAVRLMTYALADRLGPEGVRVNAVHPGVVRTSMMTEDTDFFETDESEAYLETVPSRRFAEPGDVADAALYLASNLADYVTGESLLVDGGRTNTK